MKKVDQKDVRKEEETTHEPPKNVTNEPHEKVPNMKASSSVGHADYPYPTLDQAVESAKIVISAISGSSVPIAELAHHGYIVEGFALSQILPESSPVSVSSPTKPIMHSLSDAECKHQLERFVAARSDAQGMKDSGAAAIPWLQIATFIMELIAKFLQK